MARRRRGLVDELAEAPSWVGVLLGVIGYAVLVHFLPRLEFENPFLGPLAENLPVLAPLWLIVCFAGAGLSLLRSSHRRRLHRSQRQSPNLQDLSWQDFERVIGEHFRHRGFAVTERGGTGPDGGVDLAVRRHGERHLVQCKHWRARQVGVGIIRELLGSITSERAAGGFLVTSGRVTDAASKLARQAGIHILDGRQLVSELRESVTDDAALAADVPDSPAPESKLCPRCERPMRVRTAKRGKNAGASFWGCSAFPGCRGIRPFEDKP